VALRTQANKRKLDRQLRHMRGYAGLNTPGENDSEVDEMMKQMDAARGDDQTNRGTYALRATYLDTPTESPYHLFVRASCWNVGTLERAISSRNQQPDAVCGGCLTVTSHRGERSGHRERCDAA
jgi:hypothetical protein